MSTLAQSLDRRIWPQGYLGRELWSVGLLLCCAAVLGVRLWLLPGIAMWCDESWTLMIVAQPRWAGFWREAWLDPNAPLYYLLLRFWTFVAGDSDVALRIPSLICVMAASFLPIVSRVPGLSPAGRAVWGLMIACWVPGILFSLEARCYALLLLIATAQTIAFAAVMRQPTRQAATRWCVLGALAFLTHYMAAFLILTQGAAYLARHRVRAVRTWPAALAFAPALGWAAYHLPRLLHWSSADLAWYDRVTWAEAWRFPAFVVGPMTPVFLPMLLAVAGAGWWFGRGRRTSGDGLGWIVGAGLAALLLAMIAGAARPMLSPRYLTPLVPSILLGLVLAVRDVPQPRLGFVMILAPFLAFALKAGALADFVAEQGRFGWQDGAEFVARAHPDRLVFAADSPNSDGADQTSMAQLGAVFLIRAGQHPDVRSVLLEGRGDPHPHLLAATTGAERPAILWFYDRYRGVAAQYPPAIPARYPGWRCTHRVSEDSGVMACVPAR